MVRFLAIALMALQLRPVAGVAVCAMQSPGHVPCEMAGTPHSAPAHGDQSHHGDSGSPEQPGSNCQGASVCAVNAGLSLPALARTFGQGNTRLSPRALVSTLFHTSDPIAPPVPPPNA